MYYPTKTEEENYQNNNNNISAGYPKFSEVHDYPNPANNYPLPEHYRKKKYKKQPKQEYYENDISKPKKIKHKKYPKEPTKNKAYIPLSFPQNQLYMTQGGHKYMAKPIGPPKLIPVAVKQPQYQQAYYPPPQTPPPMPIQPLPYPYYAPPVVAPAYPAYYPYPYDDYDYDFDYYY